MPCRRVNSAENCGSASAREARYAGCVRAIGATGASHAPIAYIGDMSYELDYARRLGATAFDVKDIQAPSQPPGEG